MKILVMRPSPVAEELVKNLNNIGISSWHLSLFDFINSDSSKRISVKIKQLYQADIIIICSKQVVYHTNIYLKNNFLKWPLYSKYYTIGKNTALFLKKYVKKNFFS